MSIISAGGAVTGADVATPIDPRDYFFTKTYTGNGSTLGVTGVGFQPDLVWIKDRQGVENNVLFDRLRNDAAGTTSRISSDNTGAELTGAIYAGVSSFDADGFTLGSNVLSNRSARDFVAWCWKANGAGVSNTDGSITSTVSASPDSGFSIVTYTGTGVDATVGHGLGGEIEMALSFVVSSGGSNRVVFNKYLTNDGINYTLRLNLTNGEVASAQFISASSTTIGVGGGGNANVSSATQLLYCFRSIAGFSKLGIYTGNGSATGPSVTTDFEPTFLMIKRTDSTGDWIIHDSARDASNPRTEYLEWNTADATATGNDVDFNSTGFQIKSSSATVNASGGTYIYMCIA